MTYQAIQLKHIAFLSSYKPLAIIKLEAGLNIICGASDTGKSFLAQAIDFMLGGSSLEDIPERFGYERVRLGFGSVDGDYTLERSVDGGDFLCCKGLYIDQEFEGSVKKLNSQHNAKNEDNLSRFLLKLIGLDEKRIQKNKKGDSISLSFRHLARLSVVQEEDIIKKASPALSGQYTSITSDYAAFKLILTGSDDSSLVSADKKAKTDDIKPKIEVIEKMLSEYTSDLNKFSAPIISPENGLVEIENFIDNYEEKLKLAQRNLNETVDSRQKLWRIREKKQERRLEIDELLARFELLQKHYDSDLERLSSIRESGVFFVHLEPTTCPLCGAEPKEQQHKLACDGDVSSLISAAGQDIKKIIKLKEELLQTVNDLQQEKSNLIDAIQNNTDEIEKLNQSIDKSIMPELKTQQLQYSEQLQKRAEYNQIILLKDKIDKLEGWKINLEGIVGFQNQEGSYDISPSKTALNEISTKMEELLKEWDFPNASNVYFDESSKVKDFVINGKPRASFGKGSRAILYAAFSIALLEYCHSKKLPHPGFLVIDSPLLAYYKPEGAEDNLIKGSQLKERFYRYLSQLPASMQFVIIENPHPPEDIMNSVPVTVFSANPAQGRYGLFPQRETSL